MLNGGPWFDSGVVNSDRDVLRSRYTLFSFEVDPRPSSLTSTFEVTHRDLRSGHVGVLWSVGVRPRW